MILQDNCSCYGNPMAQAEGEPKACSSSNMGSPEELNLALDRSEAAIMSAQMLFGEERLKPTSFLKGTRSTILSYFLEGEENFLSVESSYQVKEQVFPPRSITKVCALGHGAVIPYYKLLELLEVRTRRVQRREENKKASEKLITKVSVEELGNLEA